MVWLTFSEVLSIIIMAWDRSIQADMVLEKELSIVTFWPTVNRKLSETLGMDGTYMEPQSPPPQRHTSSNTVLLTLIRLLHLLIVPLSLGAFSFQTAQLPFVGLFLSQRQQWNWHTKSLLQVLSLEFKYIIKGNVLKLVYLKEEKKQKKETNICLPVFHIDADPLNRKAHKIENISQHSLMPSFCRHQAVAVLKEKEATCIV